jgi:hypothetical protein
MAKSDTVAMNVPSPHSPTLPLIRYSPLDYSHFPLLALTALAAFGCIEDVNWLALCTLLALECSCTTVANRRDLYSPQPSPELDWHRQTTTTTTMTLAEETLPLPPNR